MALYKVQLLASVSSLFLLTLLFLNVSSDHQLQNWLHLLYYGCERPIVLDQAWAAAPRFLFLLAASWGQRPMRKMAKNHSGCTFWSEALRGPLSLSSGAAGPGLRVTTNSDFIVGRPLTQYSVTFDSLSSSLGIKLVIPC